MRSEVKVVCIVVFHSEIDWMMPIDVVEWKEKRLSDPLGEYMDNLQWCNKTENIDMNFRWSIDVKIVLGC